MHSRELVELAALVVAEKESIFAADHVISDAALAQYWTASKCRIDRWHSMLRKLAKRDYRYDSRVRLRPILEEILLGEVLTRVWSAISTLCDEHAGNTEGSSIATSVLTAHTEISNRLLTALVEGRLPRAATKSLNRLRRVTERWTDLLLGRLNAPHIIKRIAHDAERAADIVDDFRSEHSIAHWQQSTMLLRTSLRAAFAGRLSSHSANPDLNARIAAAIVVCLPAETFQSPGMCSSLWFARMSSAATEMEVLVQRFLDDGMPVRQSEPHLIRCSSAGG